MYVSKVQTRPKSGCCAPVPSVDKVLYNVWLDSLNDSILAAYMLCPRGCTNKWSFLLAGLQLTIRSDGRWWTCIYSHTPPLPAANCMPWHGVHYSLHSWLYLVMTCVICTLSCWPNRSIPWGTTYRNMRSFAHCKIDANFFQQKKHIEKSANKVILFISPTPSPTISYLISYLASILSFIL